MTDNKTKEKATTEALRNMQPGETRTFHQGDALGVESARSLASRAGRLFGCRFETRADYTDNTIQITKTS